MTVQEVVKRVALAPVRNATGAPASFITVPPSVNYSPLAHGVAHDGGTP